MMLSSYIMLSHNIYVVYIYIYIVSPCGSLTYYSAHGRVGRHSGHSPVALSRRKRIAESLKVTVSQASTRANEERRFASGRFAWLLGGGGEATGEAGGFGPHLV